MEEKMNDLKALLTHEAEDLVSAEKQIIDALPAMIEKASDSQLKKALQQHLRVTEQQLKRIEKVLEMLKGEEEEKGFFANLFGGSHECKGTKGIVDEGKKVMSEDMHPDVMDSAIIACAQRIEHYEICGYGTAKAYAKELGLKEIERLLDQTLNEEYAADDSLTKLAVSRVNKEAEKPGEQTPTSRSNARSAERTESRKRSSSPAGKTQRTATSGRTQTKTSSKKAAAPKKKVTAKKAAPKKKTSKKATRSSSR